MATGKSVNLRVRPVVSTDLSFPVDGVISKQLPTMLGSRIEGLDVEVLYGMLGQTAEGDASRLVWDSKRILSYLFNVAGEAVGAGVTLMSRLRNATEAADLDLASERARGLVERPARTRAVAATGLRTRGQTRSAGLARSQAALIQG